MLMRAPKCQRTFEIGLLNTESLMNSCEFGYENTSTNRKTKTSGMRGCNKRKEIKLKSAGFT